MPSRAAGAVPDEAEPAGARQKRPAQRTSARGEGNTSLKGGRCPESTVGLWVASLTWLVAPRPVDVLLWKKTAPEGTPVAT